MNPCTNLVQQVNMSWPGLAKFITFGETDRTGLPVEEDTKIVMAMSFEIEGTLHKKFDTENKTDSFQAREFVIQIQDGNYPQFIKFQLTQDRCALVDSYNEGDGIKVHFDLRGREWQGRYFTNLNAWRIEKPQTETASAPPAAGSDVDFPTASDEPPAGDLDDLPF